MLFWLKVAHIASMAVWFTGLYEQYGFGAGVHLRRIHYRIVSSATPVLKPDGTAYENTDRSWKFLVNAGRDARYLAARIPAPAVHGSAVAAA